MYFRYGNYIHADNEVELSSLTKVSSYDQYGFLDRVTHTMSIRGVLQGSTQAALTTAIYALENAYSENGHNAALYQDDGTITPHALLFNNRAISPVKVTRLSWPEGSDKGEYATGRTYEIELQIDYNGPDGIGGNGPEVVFQESLSFRGTAGPTYAWLTPIKGEAIRQQLTEKSTQTIVQSGAGIGKSIWPTPPAPLLPDDEHEELRSITKGGPEVTGSGLNGAAILRNYPINWSYTFEVNEAQQGVPNVQT